MRGTRENYLKRLSVFIMILFIAFAQPIKAKAAGNVARIGSKNYKSLQTAMNAVKNGQTIKLLKNVKINSFMIDDSPVPKNTKNRNYTINLNKHKLIAQNKSGAGFPGVFVVKKGTVTIKNGILKGIISVEKKGTLNLSNIKFSGTGINVNTIQNSGKLTMNKVSGDLRVAGAKGSTSSLTKCKLTHTSNMLTGMGTINIKSGTYISKAKTNNPLIIMDGGGSLNIYGGTFTSPNSYIVDTHKTAVTIKGGSFTATNCAVLLLCGSSDRNAKVRISGGKFKTNQKNDPTTITGTAVKLSDVEAVISGGSFVSTTYLPDITEHVQSAGTVELSTGTLKITGGSFTGNSLSPIFIWAAAKDGAFTNTGGRLKTSCPDGTLVVDNRISN